MVHIRFENGIQIFDLKLYIYYLIFFYIPNCREGHHKFNSYMVYMARFDESSSREENSGRVKIDLSCRKVVYFRSRRNKQARVHAWSVL